MTKDRHIHVQNGFEKCNDTSRSVLRQSSAHRRTWPTRLVQLEIEKRNTQSLELDARLDGAFREEPSQTGRTVNLEAFRERNIDAGAGLIEKDKAAPISDCFKAALV